MGDHKNLGVLVLRFIIEEYGFPESEKHSLKENWLSDFSLWREVLQVLEDGVRSENIFLWNPQNCTMMQCEKNHSSPGLLHFCTAISRNTLHLTAFDPHKPRLPRLLWQKKWEQMKEEKMKIMSYLIWEFPCLGIWPALLRATGGYTPTREIMDHKRHLEVFLSVYFEWTSISHLNDPFSALVSH